MSSWKTNPLVGVILVLIIIVALVMIIKNALPKKYYYTTDLKCESCGEVFQKGIVSGTTFPVRCPKCGNKEAYHALKCLDCGEIFIFKEELPMEMMMPKCPKCGSTNIGSVTPPESRKK